MVNKPLGQTVPLVRRPSVDGQAWLYVLILALLQATGHFLKKKMVRGRVHQFSLHHSVLKWMTCYK